MLCVNDKAKIDKSKYKSIANLGIKKEYDPRTNFLKIQEMFNRIRPDDINCYGKVACNIIRAMNSRPTEPQKPRQVRLALAKLPPIRARPFRACPQRRFSL